MLFRSLKMDRLARAEREKLFDNVRLTRGFDSAMLNLLSFGILGMGSYMQGNWVYGVYQVGSLASLLGSFVVLQSNPSSGNNGSGAFFGLSLLNYAISYAGGLIIPFFYQNPTFNSSLRHALLLELDEPVANQPEAVALADAPVAAKVGFAKNRAKPEAFDLALGLGSMGPANFPFYAFGPSLGALTAIGGNLALVSDVAYDYYPGAFIVSAGLGLMLSVTPWLDIGLGPQVWLFNWQAAYGGGLQFDFGLFNVKYSLGTSGGTSLIGSIELRYLLPIGTRKN